MKSSNFATKQLITWCPGCLNLSILEAVKKALADLVNSGKYSKKEFVAVTGIGCHGKIYDYLDINGFYGLHGRVLPAALGIKIGNPKLKIIGFAGDGDTYAEGMSHFISAFRYNADITLIVHNNQSFSLTTGQATPTSQKGYKNNINLKGEFNEPINPLRLALASGGTFIARCNPRDINHTASIIKKAIKHKGFSYIEMMQECLMFNKEMNNLEKLTYKIPDNSNYKKAQRLVEKWNYNSKKAKIPIGILYQSRKPILEDKWN
jgi:2-oxoglutarate/2-oxoacid ferredoxin oxidoreductase subunit beta